MNMRFHRPSAGLLLGLLATAFVASCDDATAPPIDGDISPRISFVQDPNNANAAADLVSVFVVVTGDAFGRTVELTKDGSAWKGQVRKVPAGNYTLQVEGRDNANQIIYFGRNATVSVTRGQTTSPPVTFATTVPTMGAPTLNNTTSFTQTVRFAKVVSATGYAVEVSSSNTFANVNTYSTADTNQVVTVSDPGTWFVRTRAVLPNVAAASVPWSPSASWTVIEATGGDNEAGAIPVTFDLGTQLNLTDRNLATSKTEDWFELSVLAGDSVFLETWAQRLTPPSPLNTVLTVLSADGNTTRQSNNDADGTDSRVAFVAPVAELMLVRVTGTGSAATSVGHFELRVIVKRLPLAPTGLSATIISGTQVNLGWTDATTDETGYVVDRCEVIAAACTFAPITTTALAAGANSYNDTALLTDKTYRWRVRAVNAYGSSVNSPTAEAALFGPAAPTALTATTTSDTRISLTWNDIANNELGYELDRCVGDACSNFTLYKTLAANTGIYTDTVVYGTSYRYRVRATNAVLASTFAGPADANTLPPATPAGLAAIVGGPTRIDLSWVDIATNETGYRIERCLGDSCLNFAEIGTTAANATTYQDNSVANNAGYRYRIRAFNVVVSQTYSGITNGDTRPPSAPSTLVATTQSATAIRLDWTDNADDELGFMIERCDAASCSNFVAVDTVAPNSVTTTDATSVGNSYVYRITAIGVPGNSASNAAAANTLLPAAPSGLAAQVLGPNLVRLTWTDQSNNETQWEVLRCDGLGCTPAPLVTFPAVGASTYDDTTPVVNKNYTYEVRALNIAGASPLSGSTSASTVLPPAPNALTATTITDTQIDLAWSYPPGDVTSTSIERCEGEACDTFVVITSTGANATAFQDFGVLLGKVYRYRVRNQNVAGSSAYSPIALARTTVPSAPSSLTGRAASVSSVTLAWTDNANDETSYEVERCNPTACVYGTTATLPPGAQAYEETGLAFNQEFQYRIRALNAAGSSLGSNTVILATKFPAAPSQLIAALFSATEVRLVWSDTASNDEAAIIDRCDTALCSNFTKVADIPSANSITFSDLNVVAGATYRYRVRFSNGVGESLNSNEAEVEFYVPTAPSALSVSTISATRIDLSWADNSTNEASFGIQRCTAADCGTGTFSGIASVSSGITSYQDNSVSLGNQYGYRVVSQNVLGASIPTTAVLANTQTPATPTALDALTQPGNQIALSWTHAAVNTVRYTVLRCSGASCVPTDSVATVQAPVTVFTDAGLALGQIYRYVVRANNASGASAVSNVAQAATDYPADPVILTAEPMSATRIRITWQDNANNEIEYKVERCVGQNCASGFAAITFLTANTTAFEDEDDLGFGAVVTGAYYGYRVTASNGTGDSRPSDVINVSTFTPETPVDLVATTTSNSTIALTFSDKSDNEFSFRVERCSGDPTCTNFTPLTTLVAGATGYTDGSVVVDQVYRYRVVAVNPVGESPASGISNADTYLPAAPSTIVAATQSSTQVGLSWNDNASNEAGYRVERCADITCASPVLAAILPANTTSFQDVGVAPESSICYRVVAENVVGKSAYSAVSCASTMLPLVPTSLASSILSSSALRLTWTDNASDEDGYRLERCIGSGCTGFAQLTALAPNSTSYDDFGLATNTDYRYRLRAYNGAGNTAYTVVVVAKIALPTAPSALAATVAGTTGELSWTDAANNESEFRIERCSGVACNVFALVGTAPANPLNGLTRFDDVGIVADTVYRYRVRAANVVGQSGASATVDVNSGALPADPTSLSAQTVQIPGIGLSWTDNASNEDSYRIERCAGATCTNFTVLVSLPANATSHQDNAVVFEETYRYRVQARRAPASGGGSGYSNVAVDNTIRAEHPTSAQAITQTSTRIDVTWTDNSNNELGFIVERCLGAGCSTFSEIAQVGANITTYADLAVPTDASASYQVRAFNNAAVSEQTNVATAVANLPSIVTNLSVGQLSAAPAVRLAWDAPTPGTVTLFSVRRCEGVGCIPAVEVATVNGVETTYDDATISVNTDYVYALAAINANGTALPSDPASVNTNVPGTPVAVVASIQSSGATKVNWDIVNDAVNFGVERCEGDCISTPVFTEIGVAGSIQYIDNAVVLGMNYTYRVQARAVLGSSAFSATTMVEFSLPAAPTSLGSVVAAASQIDLLWTNNATNADSVRIERCTGVGCEGVGIYDNLARTSASQNSYSDASVASGGTYTYRVFASNNAGSSTVPSNTSTTATDVPETPTSLIAATVNAGRIDLAWDNPGVTETGFRIERCNAVTCTYAQIDEIGAGLISYQDVSVVAGVAYRYRVRAFNAAGNGAFSGPAEANTLPPSDPSTLVAVPAGPSSSTVNWSHAADNNTAIYVLERCEGAGCATFAAVADVTAPITAYLDVGLNTGTTYRYRVTAVNAADSSAFSNEFELPLTPPANPNFGTGLIPLSPTSIEVNWVDGSDNETQFSIIRCNDMPACGDLVLAGTVGPDTAQFVDSLLTPGQLYRYQVVANNLVGNSALFGLGTAITPIPAPTALASVLDGTPSALLTWAATFAGVSTVRVERCVGVGCTGYTTLVDLPSGSLTISDVSLVLGLTYRYRVVLVSADTTSAPSNEITVSAAPPAAPPSSVVVPTSSNTTRVNWTWTDDEPLGFKIEKCAGPGCTYSEIADVGAGVREYIDSPVDLNLAPTTYRVRAYNVVGTGNPSVDAAIVLTPPSAPFSLQAVELTDTQVRLTWDVVDVNTVQFEIWRCEGIGCELAEANFVLVNVAPPGDRQFIDATASPGLRYAYGIRTQNFFGSSALSLPASALMTPPTAPSGLVVAVTSGTSSNLTWNDDAVNEIGYRIERCIGAGCESLPESFTEVAAVPANVTVFGDFSLVLSSRYSYRVRAYNNLGPSAFTSDVSITTELPATVTGLVATAISGIQVNVSWTIPAPDATGYNIERCSGLGCSFAVVGTVGAGVNFYADSVPFNTTHEYRVVAFNNAGQAEFPAQTSASTVLNAPVEPRAFTLLRQVVRFRWTHDSSIEGGYQVQRCAGEGCELNDLNFGPAGFGFANDTSIIDGGLSPGTRYAYRVRAVTAGGASDWSTSQIIPFSTIPYAYTPLQITSAVTLTGLQDNQSKGERHFVINVPPGTPQLTVNMNGGGGDPDLYVRRGFAGEFGFAGIVSDTLCVPYIGGTSESCTFANPAPGDWYIMIQAYSPYALVQLTATVAPGTYAFSSCGGTGPNGPTQAMCDATYAGTQKSVSMAGGIQNWSVPFTGRWEITAVGAAGASASPGFVGGRGAGIRGELNLSAGTQLRLAVGQMGTQTDNTSGGGGGGTFVVNTSNVPLIVAGGGGGMRNAAGQNGCNASVTQFAIAGSGDIGAGWPCLPKPGGIGAGGIFTSPYNYGSAGAGFNTNGQDDLGGYGFGGRSWFSGLIGGTQGATICSGAAPGGFGGGGSGHGCWGGGGGGGYSGGDGGWIAGGGGSYNTGFNPAAFLGAGTGHGQIVIRYIGPII